MIDALAILIDQGCIDPTKYIEMECGIQHRCKDELFSSLMRSLNASQTSLCPSLSNLCSFTSFTAYLFIPTVTQSAPETMYIRLVQGFDVTGLHKNNTKPVGLFALVAWGYVKREGHPHTHPPTPKWTYLCSVFPSRGGLSCVCVQTLAFSH